MTSINNMMRMSKYGQIGAGTGGGHMGITPKFQDRTSLAQLAFSRIGNLPKYDTPRNKNVQGIQFDSQVMSPGGMTDRDTAQFRG